MNVPPVEAIPSASQHATASKSHQRMLTQGNGQRGETQPCWSGLRVLQHDTRTHKQLFCLPRTDTQKIWGKRFIGRPMLNWDSYGRNLFLALLLALLLLALLLTDTFPHLTHGCMPTWTSIRPFCRHTAEQHFFHNKQTIASAAQHQPFTQKQCISHHNITEYTFVTRQGPDRFARSVQAPEMDH